MAVRTQDEVKAFFEAADTPTEAQFIDLIDTLESNSAVKTTTISTLGTPQSIEEDFNDTTLLTQTSKQINVIIYESEYYLFNGGIGTYGLGGDTQATSANFIQISTSLSNTTLPVVEIDVQSTLAEGTALSIADLVNFINTDTGFTHATNTITVINYFSVYANNSRYRYVFNGAPDDYGITGTTVVVADFIPVSVEAYEKTVSVRNIDITYTTGDIWTDFNNDSNGPHFATVIPRTELLVITHGNYKYLFDPEINGAGGVLLYGINPGTPTVEGDFILISNDTWITQLPLFGNWANDNAKFLKTANVTLPTVDGISVIIYEDGDINYTAKMHMRGYIQMVGARAGGDQLITIVDANFNCTNPKLVYLSDEANGVMYLCKWDTDGLYAAEVIPDTTILDIDSYYYYDNEYTLAS